MLFHKKLQILAISWQGPLKNNLHLSTRQKVKLFFFRFLQNICVNKFKLPASCNRSVQSQIPWTASSCDFFVNFPWQLRFAMGVCVGPVIVFPSYQGWQWSGQNACPVICVYFSICDARLIRCPNKSLALWCSR